MEAGYVARRRAFLFLDIRMSINCPDTSILVPISRSGLTLLANIASDTQWGLPAVINARHRDASWCKPRYYTRGGVSLRLENLGTQTLLSFSSDYAELVKSLEVHECLLGSESMDTMPLTVGGVVQRVETWK